MCYVRLPSQLCLGADVVARPCGGSHVAKCIKAWACLVQDAVVSDRALKAEVERLPRALQTVWYHETRRKEAKRQTDDAGADGSGDEEATSSTAGPRLSYNRASSCSSAACDSAWAC